MNGDKPIFAVIFVGIFLYSCFFLIWSSLKPWSKKEHVAAYIAGGLLFAGSAVHLLNEFVGDPSNRYHEIIARTSTNLLGVSLGVFVCLVIYGRNK